MTRLVGALDPRSQDYQTQTPIPSFDVIRDDLKEVLKAYAEKRNVSIEDVLDQIIAEAQTLMPASGTTVATYAFENPDTAIHSFFLAIARKFSSSLPYLYRAMENLGIDPKRLKPSISWQFCDLLEYSKVSHDCEPPLLSQPSISEHKSGIDREHSLENYLSYIERDNIRLRADLEKMTQAKNEREANIAELQLRYTELEKQRNALLEEIFKLQDERIT